MEPSIRMQAVRVRVRFGKFILATIVCICWSASLSAQSVSYVANFNDNTVSVIDTSAYAVKTTIPVGSLPATVAVAPGGSAAYVANFGSNTVSVIATSTNTVVTTIGVGSEPYAVAFSPDGKRAYVSNAGDSTVSVLDTTSGTIVATISGLTSPRDIAVSPDGSRVYVVNFGGGTLSVIDTASNVVTTNISLNGNMPVGVVFSPDGTRAYVSVGQNQSANGFVAVIGTATNTVVATIQVGPAPTLLSVTPNGSLVYVANHVSAQSTGNVSVIDTASNTVVSTLSIGTGGAYGVVISPDGLHAWVTDTDAGKASVINVATNSLIAQIAVGAQPQGVAINPVIDDDAGLAELSGGNSFSGNQTVNGNVAATSFSGNGAGLTGVNAATAMMASGLNCAGCVGNTQLSINYAGSSSQGGPASNSLLLGGLAPSVFATLGSNTFAGTQFMPALSVGGNGYFNSGVVGYSGLVGNNDSNAGVFGICNACPGVLGQSNADSGVVGISQVNGTVVGAAAGFFINNQARGYILLGQSQGANKFIVDSQGDVTAAGAVTIGSGGTPIVEYVSVTDSITVPALTPGTCTTFTTPAIAGFTPGTSDTIALGTPASLVSSFLLLYQAWETTTTASPTITIQVCNPTAVKFKGGATGALRIDIFKH